MKLAILVVILTTTFAYADPDADFRAAAELAAKGDPSALGAFEAIGAARPVSRWTDDAWVEAARVAEHAGEFDRAAKDLREAIAISSDAQLARRAKRDLERIEQATGGGAWSQVAAEHQRLADDIADGGDPTRALEQLEVLARANPGYPRAVAVRIVLARGWEQEDQVGRAFGWLRDALTLASAHDLDRARIELARMLIRHRDIDEARRVVPQIADASTRASLEKSLDAAASQRIARWFALGLLVALAGLAVYLLRRRTTGWRAVAKRLVRPPAEVIYFVPIAAVVAFIALTGNPLVAKAVVWILAGAAVIAWISGVTIDAARPVTMRHALVHAAVVGVAVIAAIYLALDHARLLDLVAETWRSGPG